MAAILSRERWVKLQTVINNELFVLLLQIAARLAVICVVAANWC